MPDSSSLKPPAYRPLPLRMLIAGIICLLLAGLSLLAAMLIARHSDAVHASHEGQLVSVPSKLKMEADAKYGIALPTSLIKGENSFLACRTDGKDVFLTTGPPEQREPFTHPGLEGEYALVSYLRSRTDQEVTLTCKSAQQVFLQTPIRDTPIYQAGRASLAGILIFSLAGVLLTLVGGVRVLLAKRR